MCEWREYIEKPTILKFTSSITVLHRVAVWCNIAYIYEHFLLEHFNSIFTKQNVHTLSCAPKLLFKNNLFLPLNNYDKYFSYYKKQFTSIWRMMNQNVHHVKKWHKFSRTK